MAGAGVPVIGRYRLAGERAGCSLAGRPGRPGPPDGATRPGAARPVISCPPGPADSGPGHRCWARPGPSIGMVRSPGQRPAAEPDRLPGGSEITGQRHRIPGDLTGLVVAGPHPQTVAGQFSEQLRFRYGPGAATTATCRCKVTRASSGPPARAALAYWARAADYPWPARPGPLPEVRRRPGRPSWPPRVATMDVVGGPRRTGTRRAPSSSGPGGIGGCGARCRRRSPIQISSPGPGPAGTAHCRTGRSGSLAPGAAVRRKISAS